jgi:hypothetical protein
MGKCSAVLESGNSLGHSRLGTAESTDSVRRPNPSKTSVEGDYVWSVNRRPSLEEIVDFVLLKRPRSAGPLEVGEARHQDFVG